MKSTTPQSLNDCLMEQVRLSVLLYSLVLHPPRVSELLAVTSQLTNQSKRMKEEKAALITLVFLLLVE